jgi:hypothetical protein
MEQCCRTTVVLGLLLASGLWLSIEAAQLRAHDLSTAEVLTLPLLPEGFAATEVTLEAGLYWIDVLNRTSVRGLRIEIDRMSGPSLQAVPERHEADGLQDDNRAQFITAVRLTRGTYRVGVTGHPTWVCALNVR